MNRREFVKNGVLLSTVPTVLPFLSPFNPEDRHASASEKPEWVIKMIRRNELSIENSYKRRINDKSSPRYGAVLDGVEIASPHASVGFMKAGICCLASPESRWYNDQKLQSDLVDTAKFLLTLQHEDGTIDLVTTNFHSTPDTGFLVKYLCPAVAYFRDNKGENKEPLMKQRAKSSNLARPFMSISG